jgi:transposase-like protein
MKRRNKLTPEELEQRELVEKLIKSSQAKTPQDLRTMLTKLSKKMIEVMLENELTNHLGYDFHDKENKQTVNSRNGSSTKTLKSDFGNLSIVMPRDRDSSFKPIVIPKGSRMLEGMEEKILSLYAMGVTQRDICKFTEDIYGCELSPEAVSDIVAAVEEKVNEWLMRPLKEAYAMIFMDAAVFNIRTNGAVKNMAVNVLLGIDLYGRKDILGFWTCENESAKFWLSVLNDLKSRGVKDTFFFCIDGLKGFSQAIKAVYPESKIQRCIVHQVRYCTRFVNFKDRKELCDDMKKIYKANNEEQALTALDELAKKWDGKYPYVSKSWRENWAELSTFFAYPNEIRRLIYTTNAIESFNSLLRKYTKNRGAFMNEMSLYKLIYLASEKLMKKWSAAIKNWGLIFAQLNIMFPERMAGYVK